MEEEGTPKSKAFRFMQRIVSGSVKLYYLETTMSTTEMTSTFTPLFIKTPDGSFYNVEKKKQLKTYVIPFL